jgi:hypothetical protein
MKFSESADAAILPDAGRWEPGSMRDLAGSRILRAVVGLVVFESAAGQNLPAAWTENGAKIDAEDLEPRNR